MTSIGGNAFGSCTSLNTVNLPERFAENYESLALSAEQVFIYDGRLTGDWTYTVSDNQATITSYSGDGGEVVIPAELDGVAVVKVGDGWPPV